MSLTISINQLYYKHHKGEKMTEAYRQQLRNLRKEFYSKDKPTIKEIMEFSQQEIYLVKKMSGKF